MRESFSFARFARLFIKHTAEHYRTYLMAMSVLVGFLVLCGVFLFFVIPFTPDPGFQTASYAIVMLVAGGLFTSTVFADYGDNRTAIPALTLPATSFEKFLVGWVWSYPIFLLLYTGIYYLALVGLSSFRHWDEGQRFMYFTLRQPQLIVILVLFTELHALALFGAIYFRKLQFIRTGFVFFVASLQAGHYRFQFTQFAWTHMALYLIVVQAHFVMNNVFEGMIWFFLPASLVICNDIFAYVCGITFGRTQLIKLSPKKTVEGFVGAWVLTIIFGIGMANVLMRNKYFICPVNVSRFDLGC